MGERHLAALDGRPLDDLEPASRAALESGTVRDQVGAVLHLPGSPRYAGLRRTAPWAVSCAVEGISQACVPDPDDRLFNLLTAAIDECKAWMPKPAPVAQPPPLPHREAVEVR